MRCEVPIEKSKGKKYEGRKEKRYKVRSTKESERGTR
jgi:hypothetical protein